MNAQLLQRFVILQTMVLQQGFNFRGGVLASLFNRSPLCLWSIKQVKVFLKGSFWLASKADHTRTAVGVSFAAQSRSERLKIGKPATK